MNTTIDLKTWELLAQLRDPRGFPLIFNLCKIYFDSASAKLDVIRQALADNHSEAVAIEAHSLSSTSANLGALKLSQLFSALVSLANASALIPAGASVISQIESELRLVHFEVKKLLDGLQPHADNGLPSGLRTVLAAMPASKALSPPSPKRILIIDDDAFYRSILARTVVLVTPDPHVTAVESYAKAIDLIRQSVSGAADAVPYDLIIADLNLKTQGTGLDIWKICQVRLPQSTFLLISGTPLDEFLHLVGGQADEAPPYLPKPFRLGQCRDILIWLLGNQSKKTA